MSLGRGLGALINSSAPARQKRQYNTGEETPGLARVWNVPIGEIIADPKQPRKHFDPHELQELADSIKTHGILQPLIVMEKPDGGYELVAGERRLRASKIAGLASVPVIVKKLADQEKLEVALVENIQRQDLNPLEEAFAFKRLMEEFKLTQEEVAVKVGKSRPAVANAVRLLDLPPAVQAALSEGKISAGQGRALLSLEKTERQLEMLASMLGEKITVRELEREAGRDKKKGASRRDPNLLFLEDKLRGALGTKVNISQKGEKGTIQISYYSREELRRLIDKLGG